MHVKTEDLEIVNLDHYARIALYPDKGIFLLCAFVNPISDTEPRQSITIATFDQDEEARFALGDLYSSIETGKLVWDANGYKIRRQLQSSL